MEKQNNKAYLEGYSDGLEIIAQKLKRLSFGDLKPEALVDVLNGIIVAIHKGRSDVLNALDMQKETKVQIITINSADELKQFLEKWSGQ